MAVCGGGQGWGVRWRSVVGYEAGCEVGCEAGCEVAVCGGV